MNAPDPRPTAASDRVDIHAMGTAAAADQYLSFFLGGDEYAIHIHSVEEIKGWDTVTRVPHTPGYILGVSNLRGSIVPIIDLRVRFALERAAFDAATVVIVVHVASGRGERIVGLVVDAVSDVYSVARGELQPPPYVTGAVDQTFVVGLARLDGRLVIVLDIERLVTSSVLGGLAA